MSRSYDIQRICVLDYLSYIKNISDTLREIQSHIEQQEASLEMLGIGYSDLPKNPNMDTEKIPDGVIRLIELKGYRVLPRIHVPGPCATGGDREPGRDNVNHLPQA